jgi:hypothetical protein
MFYRIKQMYRVVNRSNCAAFALRTPVQYASGVAGSPGRIHISTLLRHAVGQDAGEVNLRKSGIKGSAERGGLQKQAALDECGFHDIP